MKYNAKYFIKKFEAIPENKWTVGEFKEDGKYCALGHCKVTNTVGTIEGNHLLYLFYQKFDCSVTSINDCSLNDYRELGTHPKERVLNALYLINAMEEYDKENSVTE